MPEPTKKPTDEQLREWAACHAGELVDHAPAMEHRRIVAAELLELRTVFHAAGITHAEELETLVCALNMWRDDCKSRPVNCCHKSCGTCHSCDVWKSLARLTATVSTEDDDG